MPMVNRVIEVKGRVQGVGYRPFVVRLAQRLGIAGTVCNSAHGVRIEVSAEPDSLEIFCSELSRIAPPSAYVEQISVQASTARQSSGFRVVASDRSSLASAVLPIDLAPCQACIADFFDPQNRRYLYPFISCQDCGPRYTITEQLPFDRERTAMSQFGLCPVCAAEYADDRDRRYHAQTIACPDCGPQLTTSFQDAVAALKAGGVIAIKGVGGYQLVASAADFGAIERIRRLKARPAKPLALMFASAAAVSEVCVIDAIECRALQSLAAPIVLLQRRSLKDRRISTNVAPAGALLGCMLPASPLHLLLAQAITDPLVVTSANRRGSPIIIERSQLEADILEDVDAIIDHNRAIIRRADDAVVRKIAGRIVTLRLGRGVAPLSLPLVPVPSLQQSSVATSVQANMGVGAQEKCTQAVVIHGRINISPHIGDLDSEHALKAWQQGLASFAQLCGAEHVRYICDCHAAYTTASSLPKNPSQVLRVQHHHAHVLACVAEHRLQGNVLGLTWDGAGYGSDGTLWGGEAFLVNGPVCERLSYLRQFYLPGGARAIREPRRSALGLLWEIQRSELIRGRFAESEWQLLQLALQQRINSPRTSSMGRLFDGVSAILGLCQIASYQDEAPSRLEALAAQASYYLDYRIPLRDGIMDWEDLLVAVLADYQRGEASAAIALGVHHALAKLAVDIARWVGVARIVLTGGCFQNALLTSLVEAALIQANFCVFTHNVIPPNDGGIAAGQALFGALHPPGGVACA